ncbi:MAG: hypothetical protein VYA84_19845 [Planctomycetota bacterium]|nr:hypothetical protein [Planctomycetota bacterium]
MKPKGTAVTDPTPQVERRGIVKTDDSSTREFVSCAIEWTGMDFMTFVQRWAMAG